jgi:hypothetical protein
MSETTQAHTPGTWVVTEGRGTTVRAYVGSPESGPYASTYVADVHTHNPEWPANARLIAAAPDLLAVAKRLRDNFNRLSTVDLGAVISAVAKAEGR